MNPPSQPLRSDDAQDSVQLSSGHPMPRLGYGTWRVAKSVVADLVEDAVREAGYRHIDCAALYNNEAQVGRAIARLLGSSRHGGAIHEEEGGEEGDDETKDTKKKKTKKKRRCNPKRAEEGTDPPSSAFALRREDLFITSKLWNTHHRRQLVIEACTKSIKELQVEYLDLYLMHWPVAMVPDARPPLRKGAYLRDEYIDSAASLKETWLAMEDLVERGLVKSIGVSNFTVRNLQELLSFASIRPAVNQIEMHPYLLQPDLCAFCRTHNIVITAYSPLGQGKELLSDSTVVAIAKRKGRTPAQVLLRWAIEHEAVVIPRTKSSEHLRSNADIFTFSLDADDMAALDALHATHPKRYMSGWIRNQWQ